MPNEEASPLHVITDSLYIIRRLFGPTMSGQEIVTQLVRDLVVMGFFPIGIDRVERWWLVSSPKDWLLESNGLESLENFRRIVRFPEAGLEACHNEIFLTAFAEAVVTRGAGHDLTWIAGDHQHRTLPTAVLDIMRDSPGRVVAFTSRDGQ